MQRRERAGAAARAFLRAPRMRRAVGAEEEARPARRRGLDERASMRLPLQDRQAVPVRPQAAGEQRVAVVQQVMRGDRRGERAVAMTVGHVVGRLLRRDVLEHDAQRRERRAQRDQLLVDEHPLAIEQVDGGIGDLAVHEQRHAARLHRFERRPAMTQVRHAGRRVRRRAGRVQLDAVDDARVLRAIDLAGRRLVGQVERHQRREGRPVGQRGDDALAVRGRGGDGRHRRPQVRHHDRAREAPGRVRQHGFERGAVAQMQVPVVGARERESIHPSSR